jgi:hypothetical protein
MLPRLELDDQVAAVAATVQQMPPVGNLVVLLERMDRAPPRGSDLFGWVGDLHHAAAVFQQREELCGGCGRARRRRHDLHRRHLHDEDCA